MRFLLLYSVVFIMAAGISKPYAAEALFFETLYDIPVMAGLEEVPDLAMSFDKPDGRIAQAGASTNYLGKNDILSFYNKSLVQMGWQVVAEGQYQRKGEQLEVSVENSANSRLVRFLLQPL